MTAILAFLCSRGSLLLLRSKNLSLPREQCAGLLLQPVHSPKSPPPKLKRERKSVVASPFAKSLFLRTEARKALFVDTPSATVSSSAAASFERASSRVGACAMSFAIIES